MGGGSGQDLHEGRLLAAKTPVQSFGVPVLSKKFPVHIRRGERDPRLISSSWGWVSNFVGGSLMVCIVHS